MRSDDIAPYLFKGSTAPRLSEVEGWKRAVAVVRQLEGLTPATANYILKELVPSLLGVSCVIPPGNPELTRLEKVLEEFPPSDR